MTNVAKSPRSRNFLAITSGSLIGTLGGLIGLGGAEFRLPVLVGMFRLGTLEAVILNKAISLVVVVSALIFRSKTISPDILATRLDVVLNLLGGSLIGAWWAAGHAMTIPKHLLNKIVMVMLVGLSLVLLAEAWAGNREAGNPLLDPGYVRIGVGLIAGFGIGVVAALLGVAGGELLIPTITLLYGVDIKLAGSLSLAVSLPTMIAGFSRYTRSDAFVVLRQERSIMWWMIAGSIPGAALGSLLLGLVPTRMIMALLGVVLLISAIKTFRHSR